MDEVGNKYDPHNMKYFEINWGIIRRGEAPPTIDVVDDQYVEIYAVSRTTPEYLVIGPNWNSRVVIGQYKATFFYKEKASFTATWW